MIDTPIPSTYPEIDGTEERDTLPVGSDWKPPSESYRVPPAPRLPLEWRQPDSRPAQFDGDLDIEVDVVFDTIRTAQAIVDDAVPPTERSRLMIVAERCNRSN